MRVLVTGATGFIGKHLCRKLINDGFSVIALVRPGSDVSALEKMGKVQFVFGDTSAPKKLALLDPFPKVVFHLAVDWENLSANIDKRFFDFLIQNGTEKIVFYSSVCAAGVDINRHQLKEKDPSVFLPKDIYGRYKYEVEQVLQSLVAEGSVNSVILRPTLVYGPGEMGNIYFLIKAIRQRKLILWDGGKQIIAPCFIDNLNTFAIKAAFSDNLVSLIYNVADREDLSAHYVTSVIADKMGFVHSFKNISKRFAFEKAFITFVLNRFELCNSLATHFAYKNWTRNYNVSLKELQSVVADAEFVPFEDAIAKTIEWYKQEKYI